MEPENRFMINHCSHRCGFDNITYGVVLFKKYIILYVNKNGITIINMLIIGGYDGFVSIVKKANRTQNTFAIKIRL